MNENPMAEDAALHSGSRWEPRPGAAEWQPADVPTDAAAEPGSRQGRGRRSLLAGAGAGILVIGGIGGFAAGHALAGTGGAFPAVVQGGTPGQNGTGTAVLGGDGDGHTGPRDGDGFHDGFHDGFGGPPGTGSLPGDGSGTSGGTA